MTKNAQLWSLDFAVATILVVTAFILLFQNYLFTSSSNSSTELATEAIQISENLLSQGLPTNWNSSNVRIPGIVEKNYRVNQTKIDALYILSQSTLRNALGATNKVTITLKKNGEIIPISGELFAGYNNTFATSIASISRIVIYDGEIHSLEVSSWQ